jgi:hypothetical protein
MGGLPRDPDTAKDYTPKNSVLNTSRILGSSQLPSRGGSAEGLELFKTLLLVRNWAHGRRLPGRRHATPLLSFTSVFFCCLRSLCLARIASRLRM